MTTGTGRPRAWSRLALYGVAFFCVGFPRWLEVSFGRPTLEQIAYHLQFNEGLVADTDSGFVVSFAVESVLIPLALAVLAWALERALVWRLEQQPRRRLATALARCVRSVPSLALLYGAALLLLQTGVPAYALSRFGDDFFSRAYVPPGKVETKPQRLKSLLLIYVEGMEATYADADLFGRNLLASMHALGGISVKRYQSAPGTTWTMGGIVATQCGIPLRPAGLRDVTTSAEQIGTFLPGAVCLGDLLKSVGYRNVFMGGARLGFAAKGQFLADHGYDERFGRAEWIQLGAQFGDMHDWGLHDDDLLARARTKLEQLQASGGLFNLTLLTLDTHHPSGFYSKRCKKRGAVDFDDVVECTSEQVAEFITSAQAAGLLENTRVVVVGDHLAMPNPLYAQLQSAPQRSIFNLFLPAGDVEKAADEALPFDLFPSILEFVGVDVEGGRLGLGYSIFDSSIRRSVQERDQLLVEVLNPSDAYDELWRPRPRRAP
jgi:phosphoglycerol transferase